MIDTLSPAAQGDPLTSCAAGDRRCRSADAVVAATATVENAELKTLNVKHYPMFHAIQPACRQ